MIYADSDSARHPCPNPHCPKAFSSIDDALEHLNDPFTSCAPRIRTPAPGESIFDIFQEEYSNYSLDSTDDEQDEVPLQPPSAPRGEYVQYHPLSSFYVEKGNNTLHEMSNDEYAQNRLENPYWPFPDEAQWKLSKWINDNLTLSQANDLLKMDWVSTNSLVLQTLTG